MGKKPCQWDEESCEQLNLYVDTEDCAFKNLVTSTTASTVFFSVKARPTRKFSTVYTIIR